MTGWTITHKEKCPMCFRTLLSTKEEKEKVGNTIYKVTHFICKCGQTWFRQEETNEAD